MSIEAARNKLLRVEPFHNFPALVLELSEKDLDGDIR